MNPKERKLVMDRALFSHFDREQYLPVVRTRTILYLTTTGICQSLHIANKKGSFLKAQQNLFILVASCSFGTCYH